MGVRGLTSYINSIESLWTQIELKNTKLIIDGPSLYSVLYMDNGLDRRCGGQYEEFYNVVLSFFDALHSRGVESFVILDGAHDSSDKKLDTFKKRAVDRIQTADALFKNSKPANGDVFVLPLLTNLVFVQALKDHGIRFAVADNEADNEIASLASAWNCPVLSNDSDFFIFDIKGGYIPLSSFEWKSNRLRANIFHRSKLASHLEIREELLPLFASLVGNDYVSWDALEPFNCALSRNQTSTGHFSRKAARFASIARLLSTQPYKSVLGMVSFHGGYQLRQAVENSLQEYTITESNLLRYFQGGVFCSSLGTQNNREVTGWILRRFRDGQFSVNCMSSLTAGTVLLRFQVENCREVSANACSQHLRRLVYGILNDAAAHNGRGKMTSPVQEWDRDGMTVRRTNVVPYQEGVVPRVSRVPGLSNEEKLEVLLVALNSNTAHIRILPEKFKLIAASLRFLARNGQPSLEANHLAALLCSCIKLEDGSWIQFMENAKRNWRISLSQPFNLKAAQSFAQWQCVLRDAVHLNFVLLEPVETPCVHKTFNGRLAHYLHNELDQGRRAEELLQPSSSVFLYKELWNALTNEREGDNGVGLNTKYSAYRTREIGGFPVQPYVPVGNKTAASSLTKQSCQPRQAEFMRQQQQETSLQRTNPPVHKDGASRWSISPSSSKPYSEDRWEKQYAAALPLEAKQQPRVCSKDQYGGTSQPITSRFNRVVPRGAYAQDIEGDEIAFRIQNLNLRASPYQEGENFATGESRHSLSTVPPRSVSPPRELSRSTYNSQSHPSHSRASPRASYNSVGYRSKSQKPSNVPTFRPKSVTMSTPSKGTHYSSPTWPTDEPKFEHQARSSYGQRYLYHQSRRPYNPHAPVRDTSSRSSEESWQGGDSIASSEEGWQDDSHYITSRDYENWEDDFY